MVHSSEDPALVVARLTEAIAAGGEMEPLVAALRVKEARRQELESAIAQIEMRVADPGSIRDQLEGYLSDWRGPLRVIVAQGQQALRRLAHGRLTFTPLDDTYRFEGIGTLEPVLGGLVQRLVSPTGRLLLYQVEIRGETRRVA